MTRAQQIAYFTDAAHRLIEAIDDRSTNKDGTAYFKLCLQEEKGHRNFTNTRNGLTATQGAALCMVGQIADYLTDNRPAPQVRDYLWTKKSLFFGYALSVNNREHILDAWKKFDITKLAELDYAVLNA